MVGLGPGDRQHPAYVTMPRLLVMCITLPG